MLKSLCFDDESCIVGVKKNQNFETQKASFHENIEFASFQIRDQIHIEHVQKNVQLLREKESLNII